LLCITNFEGKVTQHIEYFASGEQWLNQSNTSYNTRYTFTGKEQDTKTGYYNPRHSTWLSPDPILSSYMNGKVNGGAYNSMNLSLYAYGANNPVKYTDPTGEFPLLILAVPAAMIYFSTPKGTFGRMADNMSKSLAVKPNDTKGQVAAKTMIKGLSLVSGSMSATVSKTIFPKSLKITNNEEMTTLYRGVRPSHKGFNNAKRGIAKPRSRIFGHTSVVEHNREDTKSKFTSWTTDRSIATRFSGRDGVVLEKRFQSGEKIMSPDIHDENEILIRGTVRNAKATTP
jgi:RHS repeat-associated protein